MRLKTLAAAAAIALTLAAPASAAAAPPTGWILAGDTPADYAIDTEPAAGAGKRSGVLRARGAKADGFGTLMQMCQADEYRGQRVRFSANVRTEGVKQSSGLWFRVDAAEQSGIAFENMEGRPLRGSLGWKRYEIVLPVEKRAAVMAYGVLLSGAGKVWIDDVRFEAIGPVDPAAAPKRGVAARPLNLGFEE